jgi:hypothetical protein
MKFKKFAIATVAALGLSFVAAPSTHAAGNGKWDSIGNYTFKNLIQFQSDGGDLKVCVNNSNKKIKFEIDRAFSFDKAATTTGGSNNCATWRDTGGSGYVKLYFANNNRPSSVNVTVYD